MQWFGQTDTAAADTVTPSTASSCPVAHDAVQSRGTCPVAKDSINPRNFMPTYAQTPTAGQKVNLPTERTTSTIPKAEDDETAASSALWEYPSPQQFFNAVMKKGFTETQEADVPAMVQIHNAVNERAWQEILQWERDTGSQACGGVKLVRFRGDSKHVTPKARVLGLLGYTAPFDTHFWTVDRCGVKVDYVIDFYKGKQAPSTDPSKLQMPSFYLDVRPMGMEGIPARIKRAFGV